MADVFRTLIVTASNAPLAREIAASFGSGGSGMWTTPLSPSGLMPATHYISTGYIPPEFANLAPLQVWNFDETETWVMVSSEPGNPVAVYEAATQAGVVCAQDDVDEVFSSSDVTTQDPFVAMGRLGVQIIHPSMDT